MDYLDNLELTTAEYVELEIAEDMVTAGLEWRAIAEENGYYEIAEPFTLSELDDADDS